MSYPPPPHGYHQMQPVKQPKKRTLPIALGVAGLAVILCLGGIAAIGIAADKNQPAGTATTGPAAPVDQVATSKPTRPATKATSADPDRDLGAGEPGAFCATNRLGKSFVKDGVTYTCQGPKPYRWRRD